MNFACLISYTITACLSATFFAIPQVIGCGGIDGLPEDALQPSKLDFFLEETSPTGTYRSHRRPSGAKNQQAPPWVAEKE